MWPHLHLFVFSFYCVLPYLDHKEEWQLLAFFFKPRKVANTFLPRPEYDNSQRKDSDWLNLSQVTDKTKQLEVKQGQLEDFYASSRKPKELLGRQNSLPAS